MFLLRSQPITVRSTFFKHVYPYSYILIGTVRTCTRIVFLHVCLSIYIVSIYSALSFLATNYTELTQAG